MDSTNGEEHPYEEDLRLSLERARELLLSDAELEVLTGYRRPSAQLVELHKRGFHRAYLNRLGRITLERAHYHAVCVGVVEKERPKVRRLDARAQRDNKT